MDDTITRYRPYVLMFAVFALVMAGTVFFLRSPEPPTLTLVTPPMRPTTTPAVVIVDVRGAVARPGVYTLSQGSRLQDVLASAGGANGDADTSSLNLARRLADGELINVPRIGEPASGIGPAASPVKSASLRVGINTGTLEDLDRLPGIGPTLAQRIIDFRNQNGAFARLDDLKKVRGIGDALYAQVRDLISLE